MLSSICRSTTRRCSQRLASLVTPKFSKNPSPKTNFTTAAEASPGSIGSTQRWTKLGLALTGVGLLGVTSYLNAEALETTARFGRSLATGAQVTLDYKWTLRGYTEPEVRAKLVSEVHTRSAKRLVELFKKQGGVYVKAGQHIASLYYLLPIEYCDAMKELQNKAQTRPFEEIVPVFLEELKAHPSELFDEFSTTPVAAASIAQVYKAKKDSKTYAVKVQFPDVKRQSATDVKAIDVITVLVSKIFPEFKFSWLVREFEQNLPKELDFQHEAANANRVRDCFKNDPECTSPVIHSATNRILIMEWIDGVAVNDVEGIKKLGFEPRQVSQILNRVFNEQVFVHRFVHCDPHPGNVLVRPGPGGKAQVVLIDNGLYREYDEDFKHKYASLWMAILQRDESKIQRLSRDLGVKEYQLFASMLTARSYESVRNNIYRTLDSKEMMHIQSQAAERAHEITNILAAVPSPLLLLLKMNDLLRVVNQDLGVPPHKVFGTTLEFCQRSVEQHYLAKHNTWTALASVLWARASLRLKLILYDLYMSLIATMTGNK